MSVFWLALSAFAIGTEGFVIAGLLPSIATDLSISVSAAGQLVTAYALTYAVGSPILAVALNNIDRRTVLALALSTFIAGTLAAMVASNYALLLASRMLMALGSGLCMPTALAVSVAVAAPERRGRAVALVTSGLTVAPVIGVPLGNLVGITVFTYFAVPLRGRGFDAAQISLALLVFGGAAAIGNMLGGVLADRLGTMTTAALGLAGMASALVLHS